MSAFKPRVFLIYGKMPGMELDSDNRRKVAKTIRKIEVRWRRIDAEPWTDLGGEG